MTSIGAVLMVVLLTVSTPAEAQGQDQNGFFIGGAIGSATNDISANDFASGLSDSGYNVSDVTLDDSATGWKLSVGYMFNEYFGLQGSYVDLGDLETEFTASVPPDQVDDLLLRGTGLLPGRGEGFLLDVLLQYPFSERVAVYGTVGWFIAQPESEQTVISGGTGTALRSDREDDVAGSIGLKISVSDSVDMKLGYERYYIDGDSTDFPMLAVEFRF
jgi:opacity protein-like surface antigen